MLECPHFVPVLGSCQEVELRSSFLHVALGIFNGFLYLRTAHGSDYRILKHSGEVCLYITIDKCRIGFPLGIMSKSDAD